MTRETFLCLLWLVAMFFALFLMRPQPAPPSNIQYHPGPYELEPGVPQDGDVIAYDPVTKRFKWVRPEHLR